MRTRSGQVKRRKTVSPNLSELLYRDKENVNTLEAKMEKNVVIQESDIGLFNCEFDITSHDKVIGEGTDGTVECCTIGNKMVAIKRAKPWDGMSDEMCKRRSAVELYYLRRVRHVKGFVQCLGSCDGIQHTCIAFEIMDCKLSDYMRKNRHEFDDEMIHYVLKNIARAMIVLHGDIGVAHGDLAFRNILVRERKGMKLDIRLADFGRIKNLRDEPRVLEENVSFFKNEDVGSFGQILYRLCVGERVPKECIETRTLFANLSDAYITKVSPIAEQKLDKYKALFYRCVNWGIRPDFQEIYDHLSCLQHFNVGSNAMFTLKSTIGNNYRQTPKKQLSGPSSQGTTTAERTPKHGLAPKTTTNNLSTPYLFKKLARSFSTQGEEANNGSKTPRCRTNPTKNPPSNNTTPRDFISPPTHRFRGSEAFRKSSQAKEIRRYTSVKTPTHRKSTKQPGSGRTLTMKLLSQQMQLRRDTMALQHK